MAYNESISTRGGRAMKESGAIINEADLLENISDKIDTSQTDTATIKADTALIKTDVDALAAVLVPALFTRTQGAGTVLTTTLTKCGAITLTTPETLASGATLLQGFVFTAATDAGTVTVTGATSLGGGAYRVDGGAPVTVTSAV